MNTCIPVAGDEGAHPATVTVSLATESKRHPAPMRLTHWVTLIAFCALLVSGGEIVLSHPRFYWGETGNVNMRPWLNLHLPSSRASVPTGYGYVLPDQNGWSRYLHFEAAWLLVGTGLLYLLWGIFNGHFRRTLVPLRQDLAVRSLAASLVQHMKFARPSAQEARSYNVLQRLSYLVVVFVLFPLMVWSGLAMSFAFTSAFPLTASLLGGHQTARSLHFLTTIVLVGFLAVHVGMVVRSGFRSRMRAMITGRGDDKQDQG